MSQLDILLRSSERRLKEYSVQFPYVHIQIMCDSQLMIKQIIVDYKCLEAVKWLEGCYEGLLMWLHVPHWLDANGFQIQETTPKLILEECRMEGCIQMVDALIKELLDYLKDTYNTNFK